MNLSLLREMDIFGTEIKWRFLSKDNFKSYFGAMVTLLLLSLFGVKLLFFVNKTNEYGFAKNKINYQFKDNFQFLNMSDFRILIFSEIENSISDEDMDNNTSIFTNNYFNSSDYIDIQFLTLPYSDEKYMLEPKETLCSKDPKFKLVQEIDDEKLKAKFKCIVLDEGNNFLNVSKDSLNVGGSKEKDSNLIINSIPQFSIQFRMKQLLIDLLKLTKKRFLEYIMISNYKTNPQTFELEEYFSTISLQLDINSEVEADINFQKLSVTKKFEFDIFEFEFSNKHQYKFSEDSINISKNPRLESNTNRDGKFEYIDTLNFHFKVFEENNEVTFLTLDDILAVLGGFMQIIFSALQILAAFYNQKNGERSIWSYCMMKYYNYDNTVMNVRKNIDLQMDYYEKHLNMKLEKDRNKMYCFKANNTNNHNRNLNNNNKNSYKEIIGIKRGSNCNNTDSNHNSNGYSNKINDETYKSKNSFGNNYRNPNKNSKTKNKENSGLIKSSRKNKLKNGNQLILNADSTQIQNKEVFDDILTDKNYSATHANDFHFDLNSYNKMINNWNKMGSRDLIQEEVEEEYVLNEKKISDKFIQNNHCDENKKEKRIGSYICSDTIREEKEDKMSNLHRALKDFSNQLTELNNSNRISGCINHKNIVSFNNGPSLFKKVEEEKNNLLKSNVNFSNSSLDSFDKGDNSITKTNNRICNTEPRNFEDLRNLNLNNPSEDNKKNQRIENANIALACPNKINPEIFSIIKYEANDPFQYFTNRSKSKIIKTKLTNDFDINNSYENTIQEDPYKTNLFMLKQSEKFGIKNRKIDIRRMGIFSFTRKSKFLEKTYDFLELISIDRYLRLLSGFEAFKFFYFNELNKFNFDNFSDLFIFSENYRFNHFDENTLMLCEKTLPKDHKQREIFKKLIDVLQKY